MMTDAGGKNGACGGWATIVRLQMKVVGVVTARRVETACINGEGAKGKLRDRFDLSGNVCYIGDEEGEPSFSLPPF